MADEHAHHHDHHAHGEHDHDPRGASQYSLTIALLLTVGYMVIQVVGGVLSGSLALLADAAHKVTDGAAIGFALAALHFSNRPRLRRTDLWFPPP